MKKLGIHPGSNMLSTCHETNIRQKIRLGPMKTSERKEERLKETSRENGEDLECGPDMH
jgi:hypothetical protein